MKKYNPDSAVLMSLDALALEKIIGGVRQMTPMPPPTPRARKGRGKN